MHLLLFVVGWSVGLGLNRGLVWAQSSTPSDPGGGTHAPLPAYEAVLADVLSLDLLEIALWRVGAACLVLMAGILMRTTLLDRLLRPLEKLAARTKNDVDDRLIQAIRRPLGWLINLIAIYVAVLIVQVPQALHQVVVLVLQTLGTGFVAWMVFNVVDAVGAYLEGLARRSDTAVDDHLVPLVKRVMRLLVIVVMVITIIQQWGYDVTSLIAGLGLGGLAFALAAQSTLSNWFGSVMILTDRPFKIGDLVQSEHGCGVVTEIGLRSTKLMTFERSIITVPNSDLATTAVENLNKDEVLAISTTLTMTYGTSRATLERIIDQVRRLLARAEGIDNARYLVSFSGFGASSLDIDVQCYAQTRDRYEWYAIRERIFFQIMDIVEEAGGSFAFPSQSLYLETPVRLQRMGARVGAGEDVRGLSSEGLG
ncbi:mechanosensitive ion channel family protein [Lujinxingia litoralis]|nr:mechanosensitive ion channel domain-containing protein [Lujinxingia litoralis]